MSLIIAIALLLTGIWFLVSAAVALLAMIIPGGIVLLMGYGAYQLVTTLWAIERERAAYPDQRDGKQNV